MRGTQVNFWVSVQEREQLRALAKERGMTISGLVRSALLQPARQERQDSEALRVAREAYDFAEKLERRLSRLEELAGV